MTSLIDILGETSSHNPAEKFERPRPGRRQLRPDDVLDIVARRRAGENAYTVALDYGVTTEAVRLILRGDRWGATTGIRPKSEKASLSLTSRGCSTRSTPP